MKVKCYSVRLASLTQISGKAYKAVAFDGSEGIIPASQVFGEDDAIQKSDAYWISEWILRQKNLQYSTKKSAIYDTDTHRFVPTVIVERHTPERKDVVAGNEINELKR